jgi:hypothetical protein
MQFVTVGQIAAHVRRPHESVSGVIDRLREWSDDGLLKPRQESPGTGIKRLYPETAIIDALLLTGLLEVAGGLSAKRVSRLKGEAGATYLTLGQQAAQQTKTERQRGTVQYVVLFGRPQLSAQPPKLDAYSMYWAERKVGEPVPIIADAEWTVIVNISVLMKTLNTVPPSYEATLTSEPPTVTKTTKRSRPGRKPKGRT